jgi:hypothetical protein
VRKVKEEIPRAKFLPGSSDNSFLLRRWRLPAGDKKGELRMDTEP